MGKHCQECGNKTNNEKHQLCTKCWNKNKKSQTEKKEGGLDLNKEISLQIWLILALMAGSFLLGLII